MNLTDQNRREKDFHNELQSQPKGLFEKYGFVVPP